MILLGYYLYNAGCDVTTLYNLLVHNHLTWDGAGEVLSRPQRRCQTQIQLHVEGHYPSHIHVSPFIQAAPSMQILPTCPVPPNSHTKHTINTSSHTLLSLHYWLQLVVFLFQVELLPLIVSALIVGIKRYSQCLRPLWGWETLTVIEFLHFQDGLRSIVPLIITEVEAERSGTPCILNIYMALVCLNKNQALNTSTSPLLLFVIFPALFILQILHHQKIFPQEIEHKTRCLQ